MFKSESELNIGVGTTKLTNCTVISGKKGFLADWQVLFRTELHEVLSEG